MKAYERTACRVDAACGNRIKYGKNVCARERGHIGPHRDTATSEAWSFRWFDNEGTPADETDANYSVIVTRPGHDTLRIGPFGYRHLAEHATWDLESQLRNTCHPEGTTIAVAPFDESLPHLSLAPRDAMGLALQMDNEPSGNGSGSNFPDLYSRLHAEVGYEEATRLWGNACSLYDAMHAEPTDA